MRRTDRARVESLIEFVRRGGGSGGLATPDELARRFRLDPLVVRSIMISEGLSYSVMVRGPGEPRCDEADLERTRPALPDIVELRRTGS